MCVTPYPKDSISARRPILLQEYFQTLTRGQVQQLHDNPPAPKRTRDFAATFLLGKPLVDLELAAAKKGGQRA